MPKSTEITGFIINLVDDSTTSLRGCLSKDKTAKPQSFLNHETAGVWMAMQCFPHVVAPGADHSQRAWEFAVALEDYIAAFNKGSSLVDILGFCRVVKLRGYLSLLDMPPPACWNGFSGARFDYDADISRALIRVERNKPAHYYVMRLQVRSKIPCDLVET